MGIYECIIFIKFTVGVICWISYIYDLEDLQLEDFEKIETIFYTKSDDGFNSGYLYVQCGSVYRKNLAIYL